MFFILSQAWDKEKILTPYVELNLRTSDSAPRCSTTEPLRLWGEKGPIWSSYMTHCNFLILFTEHDAIDIADPSNMQDTYLLWTL